MGHDVNGTPIDPTLPATDFVMHPVIGPAGGVYCAMADWVKFLTELMRGLDGESDYLSQSTVERLFTPAAVPVEGDPTSGYALGWGVSIDPISGTVYSHAGSNGLWYALVGLSPELGRGIIAVSNGAGPAGSGARAGQAALAAMFELYLADLVE